MIWNLTEAKRLIEKKEDEWGWRRNSRFPHFHRWPSLPRSIHSHTLWHCCSCQVSLLLSAYWKKIGFKYSFRWKQNFSRLGAIFRISALNQYLMLGGKNNNLPATLTSFVSLRITDDLSHFFRISMMSHEHWLLLYKLKSWFNLSLKALCSW